MMNEITYDSLCECGHSLEDHHNAMICDGMVYEPPYTLQKSPVVYDPNIHRKYEVAPASSSWYCLENRKDFPHGHGEECEYFGFNEFGGLQLVNGRWVHHCSGFKLLKEE